MLQSVIAVMITTSQAISVVYKFIVYKCVAERRLSLMCGFFTVHRWLSALHLWYSVTLQVYLATKSNIFDIYHN